MRDQFASQVIASAINLGRKFHFDEDHALHVTKLSLSLFDQLAEEHKIAKESRLLLHVAGVLHDIGTYIRASGHHKHGQYIVENSEIFGLNHDQIAIISNLVRYHRKAMPTPRHFSYISLSRDNRILVLKLSAILRVADAIDRGHSQRVEEVDVQIRGEELFLNCKRKGDITLEQFGLQAKGNLFEEVFGYKVVLK